ncbi:MAG: nicotinate phosphoribosyltransferase [Gemmatimonadota bacterium]
MPRSSSNGAAEARDGPAPEPPSPAGSGSLALLTDLYELTMAYGYFQAADPDREAVFVLSFRDEPFDGGYAVACGMAPAVEFLERLRFQDDDLTYLASLSTAAGGPLFSSDFLEHLRGFRFRCDVDMVEEGQTVFAHAPLVRVRGPILQAQLVETALLNIVNFQTLIATKAARVTMAAGGQPVLEFGLRRAQGMDGALSASRAAYIGGCTATSNVLAGKRFGIPVAGTHAHSWVMSFDDEMTSFEAFAEAMPGNCVLLVDTYDSLQGVRNAVAVGERLRARGHELLGIRLDSGDLAYLSIEARRILDEGGFPDATIYASNELDERIIESLKLQGAAIGAWGVGTRLVTGGDQSALGGTYKLSALRQEDGAWVQRIKLSEQTAKVSIPGVLQVRRFSRGGEPIGDMIYDETDPPGESPTMIDPLDPTRRKRFGPDCDTENLLIPVMRGGERVGDLPGIEEARATARERVDRLHPTVKRFVNPHRYPVGLEEKLSAHRTKLILEGRQGTSGD